MRPVDARRCGAGALDADHMGWCHDHTEWGKGHGGDDLHIVYGPGNRRRRGTKLAQNGEFQVAGPFALATAPPIARNREGAASIEFDEFVMA